jgi:hypothetical protein
MLKIHRVRYQVTTASGLNYVVESQKLIDMIKQYNLGD